MAKIMSHIRSNTHYVGRGLILMIVTGVLFKEQLDACCIEQTSSEIPLKLQKDVQLHTFLFTQVILAN